MQTTLAWGVPTAATHIGRSAFAVTALMIAAALGLGALLPLSLAPFDWWPLGLASIGGWFWLLSHRLNQSGASHSQTGDGGMAAAPSQPNRPAASAAALGFAYGIGKFGAGVSWVYVSIHLHGNAAPWLATFLVLTFVCGLSLFSLAQAWIYAKLSTLARSRFAPAAMSGKQPAPLLFNAWLFAVVWVLFEWLLTWFLTGFPWLYPGYGHLNTPLAALLPIGGVSLASLGAVVTSVFLAPALQAKHRPAIRIIAAGAAAAPWLLGLALIPVQWVAPTAVRSAALIQGNVDQAVKWRPESRTFIVNRYRSLTAPHWDQGLIVWPESAITLFEQEAGGLLEQLSQRGAKSGAALVLGLPSAAWAPDGEAKIHNAALALGDGEGRYLKRRLVPFGDYVPFQGILRGLIDFFDLPMSYAAPGPWNQRPLRVGTDAAALAICYEIAYPNLTRTTARNADVIITISNDTWFGRSIGPLQHMQIARARALENGRWLLRATNNGVTAIVNHQGAVTGQLPQFQQGALTGNYQIMTGRTPYSRFGDAWLIALCAATLLWWLSSTRGRSP